MDDGNDRGRADRDPSAVAWEPPPRIVILERRRGLPVKLLPPFLIVMLAGLALLARVPSSPGPRERSRPQARATAPDPGPKQTQTRPAVAHSAPALTPAQARSPAAPDPWADIRREAEQARARRERLDDVKRDETARLQDAPEPPAIPPGLLDPRVLPEPSIGPILPALRDGQCPPLERMLQRQRTFQARQLARFEAARRSFDRLAPAPGGSPGGPARSGSGSRVEVRWHLRVGGW